MRYGRRLWNCQFPCVALILFDFQKFKWSLLFYHQNPFVWCSESNLHHKRDFSSNIPSVPHDFTARNGTCQYHIIIHGKIIQANIWVSATAKRFIWIYRKFFKWYSVVLLRLGTEYYGWIRRIAINTVFPRSVFAYATPWSGFITLRRDKQANRQEYKRKEQKLAFLLFNI